MFRALAIVVVVAAISAPVAAARHAPDDSAPPINSASFASTGSDQSGGLTAAGAGDTDAALGHFERALHFHASTDWPLERARTLLARGTVLRRARQWRAARESLLAARAAFGEFDAALWVARTEAELKRIAGRTATPGLTPTEARVAQLIAAGRSNKEAAAELFVTVRTIESNLSRIYAKLGIRSRTELAARLHR